MLGNANPRRNGHGDAFLVNNIIVKHRMACPMLYAVRANQVWQNHGTAMSSGNGRNKKYGAVEQVSMFSITLLEY